MAGVGKRPPVLGNSSSLAALSQREVALVEGWEVSGNQNDKDMGWLKTKNHTQPLAGCPRGSSMENQPSNIRIYLLFLFSSSKYLFPH